MSYGASYLEEFETATDGVGGDQAVDGGRVHRGESRLQSGWATTSPGMILGSGGLILRSNGSSKSGAYQVVRAVLGMVDAWSGVVRLGLE